VSLLSSVFSGLGAVLGKMTTRMTILESCEGSGIFAVCQGDPALICRKRVPSTAYLLCPELVRTLCFPCDLAGGIRGTLVLYKAT
jgi:hypothetical protein